MNSELDRLQSIVARLRAPDGCPWDREQTHESLRPGLIEECYEVVDAINRSDDENLREELGDLLLNVVMHAHMAAERSAFSLDDVMVTVCEKLIRRHPHVFGDVKAEDTATVLKNWDEIKQEERKSKNQVVSSVVDEVPAAFPALLRAEKIQKKAAKVGFDWPDAEPVIDKIHEEVAELVEAMKNRDASAMEDEIGDLFFTVVNLSRKLKLNPELALNASNEKFIRRFKALEARVQADNREVKDLSLPELDAVWDLVKQEHGTPIRNT
ncbi:MAG: nucleoside triphosphate pyrophosphohydrolase [Chthoniobacterales bacterium]